MLLAAGGMPGFVSSLAPQAQPPVETTKIAANHRRCSAALPTALLKADSILVASRRSWLGCTAATAAAILTSQGALGLETARADAIPMVTTDEFLIILRDSVRSIQVVEFSGPKSETATVKLVDGTVFGIKDVIESPTDPRSPLRIAAYCRENQVPTRFLTIEAALASAPRRKKVYTNQRVAEANEKEKERAARMDADEQARLAELYKMQEAEQAASRP
jgi:hypothetical protein